MYKLLHLSVPIIIQTILLFMFTKKIWIFKNEVLYVILLIALGAALSPAQLTLGIFYQVFIFIVYGLFYLNKNNTLEKLLNDKTAKEYAIYIKFISGDDAFLYLNAAEYYNFNLWLKKTDATYVLRHKKTIYNLSKDNILEITLHENTKLIMLQNAIDYIFKFKCPRILNFISYIRAQIAGVVFLTIIFIVFQKYNSNGASLMNSFFNSNLDISLIYEMGIDFISQIYIACYIVVSAGVVMYTFIMYPVLQKKLQERVPGKASENLWFNIVVVIGMLKLITMSNLF